MTVFLLHKKTYNSAVDELKTAINTCLFILKFLLVSNFDKQIECSFKQDSQQYKIKKVLTRKILNKYF